MDGDLGFLSAAKEGFLGVADVGDGDFIALIFVEVDTVDIDVALKEFL
jgi:hypothetical protein